MYVIVKNNKLYFKCLAPGAVVLYCTELSEAHTFCEDTDAFEFVRKHMSAFAKDLRFTDINSTITVNEIQYDPLRIAIPGTFIVFPNTEDDFASCMNPPQESEDDLVNHPSHYINSGYECIEVMEAIYGPEKVKIFCELNAFKYLWRAENKAGESEKKDIKKANWYTDKAKTILEKMEGMQ